MKKRVFAVLTVLLMLFAQAAQAAEGALCRITHKQNELWLFGSIHIGSESMYPFSEQVMAAAQGADVWIFEADETQIDQQALLARMRYEAGDSLSAHISADTLAMLQAAAKKCGYRWQALLQLKPWALVSMFGAHNLAYSLGVSDVETAVSLGVEAQLKPLINEKPIAYLETADEQFAMLESFSAPLQEWLLYDALSGIVNETGNEKSLAHWPLWWKQGDAAAFDAAYAEEEKAMPAALAREYTQKVLHSRNRTMAEKLINLLEAQGEKSCFVTVGILHLAATEQSLPSLLAQAGYTVEWME